MQISIAAAGNADTNVNLIDHRYQAEALRQLRGIDCGVLNNSFYSSASDVGLTRTPNASFMWPLTASNVQNITVGRGMATAYGIDAKSESDISFTATAPSAGTKYLFIYLQWDLSNPTEGKGDLLLHDNGSSATWTPPYQDNLITNPIGRYQMPLYRLAVNTAGTITGVVSWNTLGVLTISNPLRSQHANHAEQADFATYASNNQSDGTIDGRLIAIVNRLNALGFSVVSISGANSDYIDTANTALYKLGKVIYGYITFKHPNINGHGINGSASNVSVTVGTLSQAPHQQVQYEEEWSWSETISGYTVTHTIKLTYTVSTSGVITCTYTTQYYGFGAASASKRPIIWDKYNSRIIY